MQWLNPAKNISLSEIPQLLLIDSSAGSQLPGDCGFIFQRVVFG